MYPNHTQTEPPSISPYFIPNVQLFKYFSLFGFFKSQRWNAIISSTSCISEFDGNSTTQQQFYFPVWCLWHDLTNHCHYLHHCWVVACGFAAACRRLHAIEAPTQSLLLDYVPCRCPCHGLSSYPMCRSNYWEYALSLQHCTDCQAWSCWGRDCGPETGWWWTHECGSAVVVSLMKPQKVGGELHG